MDITFQSSNNDILRAIKATNDRNKINYYRELLVLKNRNLVNAAINPYSGFFNRDDMFQDGMMTLLSAIDSFDVDRSSIAFSTYVVRSIQHNVVNIANSNKSVVTVPVDFNHHKITVERAKREYMEQHHAIPTVEDLADLTGLCVERVKTVLNAYDFSGTMSLDETVGEDNAPLHEVIPDSEQEPPIDLDKLKDLLTTLNENEWNLLVSFFGVLGHDKRTANEMLVDGAKTSDGKPIVSKQSIHNHIKYAIRKAHRLSNAKLQRFDDYFMQN